MDSVRNGRSRTIKRVLVGLAIALGILFALGSVLDGIDRWRTTQGEGTLGTLQLERLVTKSVGRPPSIQQWGGRFSSDDGAVETFAVLGEGLPGGNGAWRAGQEVRVRQSTAKSDEVFLAADSQAFQNWVQAEIFAVVFFSLLGVVALFVRARKRRTKATT